MNSLNSWLKPAFCFAAWQHWRTKRWHVPLFTVCLAVFPFEIRPLTFTFGFFRKKPVRPELRALMDCSLSITFYIYRMSAMLQTWVYNVNHSSRQKSMQPNKIDGAPSIWVTLSFTRYRFIIMVPVRKRHSLNDFTTQSSHCVDRAGVQANMASYEFWIPSWYHDVMRTGSFSVEWVFPRTYSYTI